MSASWALAQPEAWTPANIGGKPVPAHYVRLEGLGPQTAYPILKVHQELCAKSGRAVDLPPEGSPLSRMIREDYYTETHLLVFERAQVLLINPNCVLEWQWLDPTLQVEHPHGVCEFDLRKRRARGHCHGQATGPMVELPPQWDNIPGQEVLGRDAGRNCVRTATQFGGLHSVQCVQRPPEPWRSFLYRAGGYRRGLVLADRGTHLPTNTLMRDIEAVEVRKNTTVGSDILDLARTQGFKTRQRKVHPQ